MAKNDEIVYGIHALNAFIAHSPERLIEVWFLKDREDERINSIIHLVKDLGVSYQLVSKKALDEKSESSQHQGVLARVTAGKTFDDNDIDDIYQGAIRKGEAPFFLLLDGVTDPHNLGACIRNADAAGVHAIIVPKDNAARITAVVRKVAVGAAETVPLIQVTNLARAMSMLQQRNIWIIGTAGEAEKNIYDVKLSGAIALVMGAEEKGMRRLTRENCDELVKLPMAGSVSSLNVSVATGICLFEIVRQRLANTL